MKDPNNCPYCQSERIMFVDAPGAESVTYDGKQIYPYPEEWGKDIPKYKNGSTAIPKDEIVVPYSVFKTEIRKAEEKMLEKAIKALPNERIEDDPEYIGYNCARIEIKSSLEALKK